MLIKCQISTPQFKDGKIWRYHRQFGTFNTKTMIFEPATSEMFRWANGDHEVHFSNMRDFKKSIISDITIQNNDKFNFRFK
jgi:hypothetical protein